MGQDCRIVYMGPEPPPDTSRASILWIPLIRIEPVKGASRHLASVDAEVLVFTSPRAPRIMALDAIEHGVYDRVRRVIEGSQVAVVGPSTRDSLLTYLGRPRKLLMPERYTVEDLARLLAGLKPSSIAAFRAEKASSSLHRILAEYRVGIREVKVYRNRPLTSNTLLVKAVVDRGLASIILYTSPMQVDMVAPLLEGLRGLVHIAIGPATSAKLSKNNIPHTTPEESTLNSLFQAASRICQRLDSV